MLYGNESIRCSHEHVCETHIFLGGYQMVRKAVIGIVVLNMMFVVSACKDKEPAPVVPATPPPAPVPVAEPVETEAPDTGTDTATEPELPPTEEPAADKPGGGIAKGSLVGNYTCSISGDKFPVTPPPATCKIYEGSDGNLKIGPVGSTGINGAVAIRGSRLKVTGAFNLGIGNLKVNATLGKRSAKLYKGKGTGTFAGATIKYTLTLKKK
jgi:hypothetical protein